MPINILEGKIHEMRIWINRNSVRMGHREFAL